MFPITLLIALVIAFGIDTPRLGVPPSDVGYRVLETCGGISVVALLSLGLGLWVASRASHDGFPASRLRHRYAAGTRLLSAISLLVYGWIIHSVGWSRLVGMNWGFEGLGIVRDILVFLPFVIIQVLIWSGQFLAERALQARVAVPPTARLVRYLVSRSRQALGLVLPMILLFVIRRDVIGRLWPAWEDDALAEPLEIALLGSMVLIAAPLFIRIAWPTRPLPEGPLRRRLERAARRAGFRFTDVLVWDTGGLVLNACVTGVVPGFRYVLLSDALVDTMTPVEVAAVFGHEIGHVAHRHLLFFGLFFAGSLGVLALLADGVSRGIGWVSHAPWLASWIPQAGAVALREAIVLIVLGFYFWLVFGYLSRRFERQADIFGSKVVSCRMADCTGHAHLDGESQAESAGSAPLPLCRTGLRTFAEALRIVAQCNGINLHRRSWRHGSIAARIGFLERLGGDPALERRFQRDVVRLRLLLGLVMILALVAATVKQALANG
jgi:STE24 endopeptidase